MHCYISNSRLLRLSSLVLFCLSLSITGSARAADVIWDGSNDNKWSTGANWTGNTSPSLTSDVVRFDGNSAGNLATNNDIVGLSIAGIANTSDGTTNVTGSPHIGATFTQVSITGNPLTIGALGITNGSGNPKDPNGYLAAQVDLTVDVDITLSADQRWKEGGPGTNSPSTGRTQAIIIGATPNAHTVTLNGFKPTLTMISNANDMIVVNSKLVDGSTPSKVGISKITGTTTTFSLDSGNINNNPRIRFNSDSTYSGGTEIIGGRQLMQFNTSSVPGVSGPLGLGPITIRTESLVSGSITNQTPYFSPFGADRSLDNDIILNNVITNTGGTPGNSFPRLNNSGATTDASDDTALRTLTLNGAISIPTAGQVMENNTLGASGSHATGSGDMIVNGTVLLGGADFDGNGLMDASDYVVWRKNPAAYGGADGYRIWTETFGTSITTPVAEAVPADATTFGVGQPGGAPSFAAGKQVFNGNILQTNGVTHTLLVTGGDGTRPVVVRLNGQNTFGAMTVVSTAPLDTTGNANVQIGSSSVLSGSTIISGPLGTGTVTINSGAGSSFEAVGAARTVNNPFVQSTNQSVLMVQGTQDLTLNGVISGPSGLTKNGTATLTLGGINTYTNTTTVNSGTLLVNGSLASSPSVNAGSTLGGTGTINNDISLSGTLAPGVGATPGTLTATGNVTDSPGAIWNIDLSGASADKLVVGGALTLAGDTLNISGVGSGGNWVIATYTGTLSGTFGTITPGFSVNYGTGTNSQITLTSPGVGAGGAVPEPSAALLVFIGLAIGSLRRSRSRG
jgi:autotransporter-associated beta strand protein